MKKTRILFSVLACIALIVCVIIVGSIQQRKSNPETEIPEEARIVLQKYMDASKNGPEEAIAFAHFEDEFIRTAYLHADSKLIDYEIENVEMVNDNLVALTINIKTTQTVRRSGDNFETAYNFLVKIDGEWYFVNGVSHIPQNIRDGLDVTKYTYDDENIIDHNNVFSIDLAP